MIYDKNGKGYKVGIFTIDSYVGPAPLYFVEPQTLGVNQNSPCPDYPDIIDAGIAQNGIPIYPVLISAKNNAKSEWLKVGESYSLDVTATIGDYFSTESYYVKLQNLSQPYKVKFFLSASNFEFSHSNQDVQSIPLGYKIPAEQTWSIAPIERANGDHFLGMVHFSHI